MSKAESPYYPPRARWFAPLFYTFAHLGRRMALDRIHLPYGTSFLGLVAAFVVPGFGFYVRGPGRYGLAVISACGLLFLISISELGRTAGNIAFGLLLSVHATGFGLLFQPWLVGVAFRTRALFSLALLGVLALLLYLPARNYVQAHWFTPMQHGDRIAIVRKYATMPPLQRGETIAYSLEGSPNHQAYVAAGFGLSPVLGLPGDYLRFTPNGLEINGVAGPSLAYLPQSGELVVPEKHWFVWPEFDIGGHGNLGNGAVSSTILGMATITEAQFIGKSFKWWFWHRQVRL